MINDTLREYLNKFVIICLNNILIYFETFRKHIKHIKKIELFYEKKNYV